MKDETTLLTFGCDLQLIHFFHFLDEYGLDPYEFRLYTHIVRITGGKEEGVCFASLKKTAQICKMSVRKAQQALKVLITAKLQQFSCICTTSFLLSSFLPLRLCVFA